jgi:transcription-repair coupling factor (superfamily II helicase)
MEELGMEGNYTPTHQKENFISECTVETDKPAYILDSYIDLNVEKIRIYKELDTITDARSLEKSKDRLCDRFGRLPQEVENLFFVVQIRMAGKRLGLEKIIVKNGILISFFISNPMSSYYKSEVFAKILDKISGSGNRYELKQGTDEKLKIVVRNVDSLQKALSVIEELGS